MTVTHDRSAGWNDRSIWIVTCCTFRGAAIIGGPLITAVIDLRIVAVPGTGMRMRGPHVMAHLMGDHLHIPGVRRKLHNGCGEVGTKGDLVGGRTKHIDIGNTSAERTCTQQVSQATIIRETGDVGLKCVENSARSIVGCKWICGRIDQHTGHTDRDTFIFIQGADFIP